MSSSREATGSSCTTSAWAEIVLTNRRAPEGTGVALRRALADVVHDLPVASRLLDPDQPV